MKKSIFVVLLVLALLPSCRNSQPKEKTQHDAEVEFNASLTEDSRSQVLSLADSFMQLLKDNQIDQALGMIYVLSENVLYLPGDNYLKQLRQRFNSFPVCEYTLVSSSFSTPGNNDISYRYEFRPRVDQDTPGPTMKLMFNPVFVEGNWYLTFKDGTQSSKDLAPTEQINDLAPAPEEIRINRRPID